MKLNSVLQELPIIAKVPSTFLLQLETDCLIFPKMIVYSEMMFSALAPLLRWRLKTILACFQLSPFTVQLILDMLNGLDESSIHQKYFLLSIFAPRSVISFLSMLFIFTVLHSASCIEFLGNPRKDQSSENSITCH